MTLCYPSQYTYESEGDAINNYFGIALSTGTVLGKPGCFPRSPEYGHSTQNLE